MRKVYVPLYIIEWSDVRPYAIMAWHGVQTGAHYFWVGLLLFCKYAWIFLKKVSKALAEAFVRFCKGLLNVFVMADPRAEDDSEEEDDEEAAPGNGASRPATPRSIFDED